MRIFQVCADAGIAPDGTKGASIHFRSLHRALATAGHDVTAFMAKAQESHGFDYRVLVHLKATRSILDFASARVPDFIYERYGLGQTAGLTAARRLERPFILEVNAPLVREASEHRPETLRPEHAEIERRLFREADVVVAVSEPLRELVAKVRGSDDGTAVVPNGFDPDLGAASPPASRGERPGPVIAFLGHPKPWHGADRLVPLLAAVRVRVPDARLLVIGGGPGADAVLAEARVAGLSDHVEVSGPVSQGIALGLLSRAAVSVAPYPPTPSFYFCPLKVIESMGRGIAVVSTAQGDLPSIVGNAGILVPPGDSRALADAVAGLLEHPLVRAEIAARGRARALARFTWAQAAQRVCDLAASVLIAGSKAR